MTKEQLLGKICLADAINECCSEDGNTSCEKCELEMSIMLDKFAKQIKSDAIEELVDGLHKFWNDLSHLEVVTIEEVFDALNIVIAEQLKEQT